MNGSDESAAAFTHFDATGQAHMVDVRDKTATHRIAIARGLIRMNTQAIEGIDRGQMNKGDVLGVARIAAIQAAKRTADLIPLCHPIALTRVAVDFSVDTSSLAVQCTATAETVGVTGVEMEALTAVQVGLLTIYDMCKALDHGMVIEQVRLIEKRGGKNGDWKSE